LQTWLNLVLLSVGECLTLMFVVLCLRQGHGRYIYLSFYVGSMFVLDPVRRVFDNVYGFQSREYFLAYYFTDFLLLLLKCVAILVLFDIALQHSRWRMESRLAALLRIAFMIAVSSVFRLAIFAAVPPSGCGKGDGAQYEFSC
jgi:hypothetical protein